MDKQPSVKTNFLMNLLTKFSAVFFSLITFPYVSRVLSPDGLGKVALALSLTEYFTMAASLGIPTYGITICAKQRRNRTQLSNTVWELLFLQGIMTVLSCVIFICMVLCIPKLREERLLYIVQFLVLASAAFNTEWVYGALEQYQYIAIKTTAIRVISALLMFRLVKGSDDYVLYALTMAFFTVASHLINLIQLRKNVGWPVLGTLNICKHLKASLAYLGQTVAITLYINMDSVMLGLLTTDAELGLYTVALKMKNVLGNVVTSLGMVLMPRMSLYAVEGKQEDILRVINKSFKYVLWGMIPLVVFLTYSATDCIKVLFGGQYLGATSVMRLLMISLFFISLSNITGYGILTPANQEGLVLKSVCVGAAVNFILNAALIPRFSILGAGTATLITEILVLVIQLHGVFKTEIKPHVDWRESGKILFSTGLAMGLVLVVRGAIAETSVLSLSTDCVVFAVSYICGLLFVKEELSISICVGLKELAKNKWKNFF